MADNLNEAFCKRLRQLRAHFKLTQEQAAERAGLNYKHYQEIERGAKNEVRFSTLAKIAHAFGISMQQLFSDDPPHLIFAESPPDESKRQKQRILPPAQKKSSYPKKRRHSK